MGLLMSEKRLGKQRRSSSPDPNPRKIHPLKAEAARAILLISIQLLFITACAKVGEPQPPEIRIPKPGVDLAVRQISDHIVLSVSMPVQNTDGSDVSTLHGVEVLRIAEKSKNGENTQPLSQEQFIDRSSRIISIPESRIQDYLQDGSLVIRDMLRFQDRSEIYSYAFRYGVVFVNNKNEAAGLSNQVFIKPIPIPAAPTGLSSEVNEHSIDLRWLEPHENMNGSKPARIAGYKVFRSEDAQKFPATPINTVPLQKPEYTDSDFLFDKTYYYDVSVVGSFQNPYAESNPSAPHMVIPRDTFPPDSPRNFNAVLERGIVILLWMAPESQDVAGYRIFKTEEGTAATQTLQKKLITALSFRDSDVLSNRNYEYSIVAVDGHGNESKAIHTKVEVR